jgi:hypothetical protein
MWIPLESRENGKMALYYTYWTQPGQKTFRITVIERFAATVPRRSVGVLGEPDAMFANIQTFGVPCESFNDAAVFAHNRRRTPFFSDLQSLINQFERKLNLA